MSKFFVPFENIQENNIFIYGEDVNHISKVLRLEQNDIIIVCDGNGRDYKVIIKEISKNKINTVILESFDCVTERPINITLYQGIPKSSKMEYIIQKTTELGISSIVPVITKRTVVKMETKKASSKKISRWQRIAHEAAKQSNRGKVPNILNVIDFDSAIEQIKDMDLAFMPYEQERSNNLKKVIEGIQCNNIKNIGIIIGPEGGFEEDEVQKCIDNNINIISLGPRIMRTETAGVVGTTLIMYELGDI